MLPDAPSYVGLPTALSLHKLAKMSDSSDALRRYHPYGQLLTRYLDLDLDLDLDLYLDLDFTSI